MLYISTRMCGSTYFACMLVHCYIWWVCTHVYVFVDVPEILTWCVLSFGEQRKCEDMALAFQRKGLSPNIQCLHGTSVDDCMEKIQVEQFSWELKVVILRCFLKPTLKFPLRVQKRAKRQMPSLSMEATSTLQGRNMAWFLLQEKATQVRASLSMSHCSHIIDCSNVNATVFS